MEQEKKKIIVIAGPTAVGKTAAAVALAAELDTEIVSADSMQVYRGMDIGTAKVTEEEARGIRHHLIDVMDPHEDYNVVAFREMADRALAKIHVAGKIPIVCGGTGFYIQALLYDIDFLQEGETPLRAQLFRKAEEEGAEALHRELEAVDPEAAAKIPANNVKRTVRAIEFFRLHGKKISEHNAEEEAGKADPRFDTRLFVLYDERERLYSRINDRVDRMFEAGLPEEVQRLKEAGVGRGTTAMQAIGYRQLYAYLEGECTLEEAKERIKTESRRYAKKQLTWFKREKNAVWINAGTGNTVDEIRKHLW